MSTFNAQDIDFELLFNSSKNEELILVEGGLCHFHCRKDLQCTIRSILGQGEN